MKIFPLIVHVHVEMVSFITTEVSVNVTDCPKQTAVALVVNPARIGLPGITGREYAPVHPESEVTVSVTVKVPEEV